jgi:hypothetical protein
MAAQKVCRTLGIGRFPGSGAISYLKADEQARQSGAGAAGQPGGDYAQARILAFSRSNSSGVMTPRSRRSASLASWSAGLACVPAASWT